MGRRAFDESRPPYHRTRGTHDRPSVTRAFHVVAITISRLGLN